MMRTTLRETLEKTGILVIDGSMSTALEQLGCDLNDRLWTAKALDQQPELVRQVHENYFVFRRHLQQAKLRIVSPIAQELRVHRKDGRSRRALDKRLETRLVFYDHFPTVTFLRST